MKHSTRASVGNISRLHQRKTFGSWVFLRFFKLLDSDRFESLFKAHPYQQPNSEYRVPHTVGQHAVENLETVVPFSPGLETDSFAVPVDPIICPISL